VARPAEFDLARALLQPNFTAGARDGAALILLIMHHDDDAVTKRATAELCKLAAATALLTEALAAQSKEPAQSQLIIALGARALTDDAAVAELLCRYQDWQRLTPRSRRFAAAALGRLRRPDANDALIARWQQADVAVDERRALLTAISQCGDVRVADVLASAPSDDAELARRRDRGRIISHRDALRVDVDTAQSFVDIHRGLPFAVTVRLSCRHGFGPLLRDELVQVAPGLRVQTDSQRRDPQFDWVDVDVASSLHTLMHSRCWMTAGIVRQLPRAATLEASVVDAICHPEVLGLLQKLTAGPLRWRLDFTSGGHQRAVVWRIAEQVSARQPLLVNDPSDTAWDVIVDEKRGCLELRPRGIDQRFAWRVSDVPASSHPTVAAALVQLAQPRDSDVIWDPFVGAGAELIECARRTTSRQPKGLIGSDLSDTAVEAARANFAKAAELQLCSRDPALHVGDARTIDIGNVGGVSLIISNPPLGGRIRGDAPALLNECLPIFHRYLTAAGRLVWITPAADRTDPTALRLGLRNVRDMAVNLGGIPARVQLWQKRG
jgi:hypothetical protein